MKELENVKIDLAIAGASTGTSTLASADIDMTGYEGIIFVGSLATANAGNFMQAVHGDAPTPTDTVAGSKVVPATDGDVAILEIHRPLKKYVRVQLVRAGATTVSGDVYAIRYGARKDPQTNEVTNAVKTASLISPATGTP